MLKADHVAGGAFIALGIAVFALSGDLPFGTLSQPGAGMMPKLMAGLMMAFAIAMMATAHDGQPFAAIDWSDIGHAALVVIIAALAVISYTRLGFILTMALLVFALLVVVERKNPFYAALYAVSLTLFAWALFGKVLKAPLERGILGF
jgi:NADH:ubiquinone oxidoreductase subunit 6 (subunit J)